MGCIICHTWFLRGGRAKTKLVSKEFFARCFRTVSSRERAMEGDPCDSGRVPIARNPRGYLLPGWSLFTPSQSHRGSPMPFNFGFCALSAKTRSYLFPRPPYPVEGGLGRRARPSPAGRAFPRRPHDHFLLPLPLALAILPPLARDAEIIQIMLRPLIWKAPTCCSRLLKKTRLLRTHNVSRA